MFPLLSLGVAALLPTEPSGRPALAARLFGGDSERGTGLLERGTSTRSGAEPEKPKMYGVVLYNSPRMDGVVVKEVLQEVFRKTAGEATRLMLGAHSSGKALCGMYTKEVAEMKHKQGMEAAAAKMQAKHGFAGDMTLRVEEQ